MLKVVGIAAAVLVAGVLVYAATLPDSFRVERSTVIQAPPAKVFAFVEDLRKWTAWSPWEYIDPAFRRSYSGAASGKGAARVDRKWIVRVAILSPLAYILVLSAMVFTPVSYVAPAREMSILFAALMGAHFLREPDPARRLNAAGLIVAGIVGLAFG